MAFEELKAELEALQKQVEEKVQTLADLDREIDIRGCLRGIHADIDSIKHQLKSLIFPSTLDAIVNPDIDKIMAEIRKEYTMKRRPKRKAKK